MAARWTTKDLIWLEDTVSSARQIARWRLKMVAQGGYAASFVPLLDEVVASWFARLATRSPSTLEERNQMVMNTVGGCSPASLACSPETLRLGRIIQIHLAISRLDITLADELGREGSHRILLRIARYDATLWKEEVDRDCIMDVQDLVCEVAARAGGSFPINVAPLSVEVVRTRLPLQFEFGDLGMIWIHQVNERQTSQHDVGFVMWPSALVLARWLCLNPDIIRGKRVLELGAGCGLVGLVAAKLQSVQRGHVILTDFNPVVLENARRNICLNNVESVATARGLDFYQQSGRADMWVDTDGESQAPVDVVLAADMICQPSDAVAAAKSIYVALVRGGRAVAICADATHRFGVDRFAQECTRVGLSVSTSNADWAIDDVLCRKEMNLTMGFVSDMMLKMFDITKQ